MEGHKEAPCYYSIGYDVEMFTDVLQMTKHDEDTHDKHHININELVKRIAQ